MDDREEEKIWFQKKSGRVASLSFDAKRNTNGTTGRRQRTPRGARRGRTMTKPTGVNVNDHDARYEPVNDSLLGTGSYGYTKLMREKATGKMYALKYIERGEKITEHVRREITNHRNLAHPNIVKFKEVLVTPRHLAVAMEAIGGGELFGYVQQQGNFNESQARYFFQHLISGVEYLHNMRISHRDLKLENTLVDLTSTPVLKICDFGFSKGGFDSQPKTQIGTPAYISPEVYRGSQPYDGAASDVWACGVLLYVMLVGRYPFSDPSDPNNSHKMMQRVLSAKFDIPERLTDECKDLLTKIFNVDPKTRISVSGIYSHPWFLHDLSPSVPLGESQPGPCAGNTEGLQSLEEINSIIDVAREPPEHASSPWGYDEIDGDGIDDGNYLDDDY
jgi:serine/threonine-protein kinase SRK2